MLPIAVHPARPILGGITFDWTNLGGTAIAAAHTITPDRRPFGIAVVGGPTVVIDIAGLRLVSDPTFDAPGEHANLSKTTSPSVDIAALGPVDAILLSHADHADNLDDTGRAFAESAPVILTSPFSAGQLRGNPVGLEPWATHELGNGVLITAVPAQHGPTDGERTPEGFITTDVTGFIVTHPDGTVVYVSGDNASLRVVTDIHDRFPRIDYAVLHAGAASVPARHDGRPLSLSADRAAAAAEVLGAQRVIVAHDEGWAHFTQGPHDVVAAFQRAGILDLLDRAELGTWAEV